MAKATSTQRVSAIIEKLEALAPSGTAEKWDNVGLLAGDPAWETRGAVVSVDLTEEALRTAVRKGYRLIVNHHPCIFPKGKGLSRLVPGAKAGIPSLLFEAIRNGIAVAACHTNFDQCSLEVVRAISGGLGVRPAGRLLDVGEGTLLKLVAFIPESHVSTVRAALCAAGAGHIGNYDSCTFSASGEGTFRGGEGARPFLGSAGRLEKARETRLETIFPKGLKKAVLTALRSAHPYEEVAFDLYPVEQGPASIGLVRGLGYGFWGDFSSPKTFAEVARGVRRVFRTEGFILTESPKRKSQAPRTSPGTSRGTCMIRRVAFVAGKGASFVDAAAAAGCDLFITGEAGYHPSLDAARKGMSILELGHRESEVFFIETMQDWLTAMGMKAVGLNLKTQAIISGRYSE